MLISFISPICICTKIFSFLIPNEYLFLYYKPSSTIINISSSIIFGECYLGWIKKNFFLSTKCDSLYCNIIYHPVNERKCWNILNDECVMHNNRSTSHAFSIIYYLMHFQSFSTAHTYLTKIFAYVSVENFHKLRFLHIYSSIKCKSVC